jgi:hypothetical protein
VGTEIANSAPLALKIGEKSRAKPATKGEKRSEKRKAKELTLAAAVLIILAALVNIC